MKTVKNRGKAAVHKKETARRFGISTCSLGHVLVATSDVGICAITLGDDPEFLWSDLQDRFPGAKRTRKDRTFQKTLAAVVRFVERPVKKFPLPLDVHGTPFQKQVWRALQKIPLATTATYSDIAKRIGKPTAFRAVAQACGANHIAVVIPCHRVVGSDGSLSGYRWGVKRKKALLKRESGN